MTNQNFRKFKAALLKTFPGQTLISKVSSDTETPLFTVTIHTFNPLNMGSMLAVALLAREHHLIPHQTDHFSQWIEDTYLEFHSWEEHCQFYFTYNSSIQLLTAVAY